MAVTRMNLYTYTVFFLLETRKLYLNNWNTVCSFIETRCNYAKLMNDFNNCTIDYQNSYYSLTKVTPV